MRRLTVLTPAFVLIAACGGGPVKQESASARSTGPASDRASSIGDDTAPSK